MRDDARSVQPYQPPSIEARDPIDVPLIGGTSAIPPTGSAAFRSVPSEPYQAPRIEARDPIDVPLIGNTSASISAAFRPDQIAEDQIAQE